MKRQVVWVQRDGCIEVEICTDSIDFFNASIILKSIQHVLEETRYPNTIINMKNVTDLSSTGVGLLMEIKSILLHNGRDLSIVCVDKSILSVFYITNMKSYFDIRTHLESAAQQYACG
ncbi:MAG: STAS domain-containing protein [Spirochaetes bacterium]|nr:MAG: STAS domain-containing protein [Spirochaetota bacterium]